MIRKIIRIEEAKCNGCGLCVKGCHEGAIGMVEGKARLLRDDYCDGLGDCLPTCPTGAIRFEEREAAAYDEAAVKANMEAAKQPETLACGCPGTHAKAIEREPEKATVAAVANAGEVQEPPSQLAQWPVQLRLVPVSAPYFDGAHLLVAADCAAYASAGLHERYMKGRVTVIGCPKLDEADYEEKLLAILQGNDIKSVTVVRMEVPCCAGIANAAVGALQRCGKMLPWRVVTLDTEGRVVDEGI